MKKKSIHSTPFQNTEGEQTNTQTSKLTHLPCQKAGGVKRYKVYQGIIFFKDFSINIKKEQKWVNHVKWPKPHNASFHIRWWMPWEFILYRLSIVIFILNLFIL